MFALRSCPVPVVLSKDQRQRRVRFPKLRIKLYGFERGFFRFGKGLLWSYIRVEGKEVVRVGQCDVGQRITGVDLNRSVVFGNGLLKFIRRVKIPVVKPSEIRFIAAVFTGRERSNRACSCGVN